MTLFHFLHIFSIAQSNWRQTRSLWRERYNFYSDSTIHGVSESKADKEHNEQQIAHISYFLTEAMGACCNTDRWGGCDTRVPWGYPRSHKAGTIKPPTPSTNE